MTAQLVHRGPDGSGIWAEGRCALGHRRLAIIDPTGSPQPMTSADGRYTLTYNGELFNYEALRRQLNYPFRTSGDTETLLAAYAERGSRALGDFEGQFAFAVYDRNDETLSLFRDQLGILPLYWYADDERLLFASEIKALLPLLPSGPELDIATLDEYLTQRSVHAPRTLFAGIRKLPAGHRLRIGPSGTIDVQRYWDLPGRGAVRPLSAPDAVNAVDAALGSAVRAATVADVPVGAYLSGGVDSSLICALVRQQSPGAPLHTFSAGFTDVDAGGSSGGSASQSTDELPYAREVSARLGTTHHEVSLSADDFVADWGRLTWHRDAPLSEPADIAVHRLAALAKPDVTVLLSGEGSDELFAGYRKYQVAQRAQAIWRMPQALRQPVARRLDSHLMGRLAPLRAPLQALGAESVDAWAQAWFSPFSEPGRRRLLPSGSPAAGVLADPRGDLHDLLEYDTRTWLADNLLERGDRMSMAASVEMRPPFLDRRVVELAFRLPDDVKLRGGVGKWVVKEVARRYLPANIVDRKKAGFPVPIDSWFRGGLADMAHDLLTASDALAASVFEPGEVRALLGRHRRGESNEGIRLYALVGLEIWHRTFFGADQADVSPWAESPLPSPA